MMRLPAKFPLIITALYFVINEILFHYFESGGRREYASLNTFFYIMFVEGFHMIRSEATLLIYLVFSGSLFYFILSNVKDATFRVLFAGLICLITLWYFNANRMAKYGLLDDCPAIIGLVTERRYGGVIPEAWRGDISITSRDDPFFVPPKMTPPKPGMVDCNNLKATWTIVETAPTTRWNSFFNT